MAKRNELPGFKEKREILFGKKSSPQKLREVGISFMEAERYDDALEFFSRVEADELVRQIAEVALKSGDTPLYMRAKKVLAETITEQEWDTLAANALQRGAVSKAYVAKLKAGKQQEAEDLKAQLDACGPGNASEDSSQQPNHTDASP